MIDDSHDLPIARQAKALGLARSAVYYMPRPVSAEDLKLMRSLGELHLDYPFAGAWMLRNLLRREGVKQPEPASTKDAFAIQAQCAYRSRYAPDSTSIGLTKFAPCGTKRISNQKIVMQSMRLQEGHIQSQSVGIFFGPKSAKERHWIVEYHYWSSSGTQRSTWQAATIQRVRIVENISKKDQRHCRRLPQGQSGPFRTARAPTHARGLYHSNKTIRREMVADDRLVAASVPIKY